MVKIIVLDLDMFNPLRLDIKNKAIKKLFFSLMEFLEGLLKIDQKINQEVINLLDHLPEEVKIFVISGRSEKGIRNIWKTIQIIGIRDGMDFIQIRGTGDNKKTQPFPMINRCCEKENLSRIREISEKSKVPSGEVLVVSNDEEFLKTAKVFGFRRFPQQGCLSVMTIEHLLIF